jgi:hypothetical protein
MNPDQNDKDLEQTPDEEGPTEASVVDTSANDQDDQPDSTRSEEPTADEGEAPVHWTAHEYIHSEKNGLWYILFAIVVLGLIAIDIFVLKSYTFSALVVVMAIALIVYSRRAPREVQYALSGGQGLYVGERLYHFSDFKAFGLIKDGEHHSIMLIPTKRFALGLSVYFPEEAGEEIVDILGARLPMKPLKLDFMDVLIRRLRL